MFDAIADFATKDAPSSLRTVRIVIYNDPQLQAMFTNALWKKVEDAKSGHPTTFHWMAVRATFSSLCDCHAVPYRIANHTTSTVLLYCTVVFSTLFYSTVHYTTLD